MADDVADLGDDHRESSLGRRRGDRHGTRSSVSADDMGVRSKRRPIMEATATVHSRPPKRVRATPEIVI